MQLDENQVLYAQNKAKRLQGHHMFLESMTVGSNAANVTKNQMDFDPKLCSCLQLCSQLSHSRKKSELFTL